MALRVLLADESSTIKKVFQLALQDYAVEVKPVALGVDVHAVSTSFRPDIIFADILLQKRNGYEVCAELKSDPQLANIPVVLMWSGFMELDRDKFEACGADGRLEKPFDVNQLRKVVQEFVGKTKTQSIGDYLDFPEAREEAAQMPQDMVENEEVPEVPNTEESQEEFDDFQPVSFQKSQKFQIEGDDDEADSGEFVFKSNTVVDGPAAVPEKTKTGVIPKKSAPVEELEVEDEDFSFHRPGQEGTQTGASASASFGGLNPQEVREIVERLAPKIIEEIAWKVVPELATQIIERELKSLLAQKESEVSP